MTIFKQAQTIDRSYGKTSRKLHKTAKEKCLEAESKTLYAPKTTPFSLEKHKQFKKKILKGCKQTVTDFIK